VTAEAPTSQRHWTVAVAALVAVVLALVAASAWSAATRTRHVTTVVQRTAPAAAIAVADCPAEALCDSSAHARSQVVDRVRTEFGAVTIVSSEAIVASDSGKPYREFVQALTSSGVEVDVTTRCVVGGATPASSQPSAIPARGPAELAVVVALAQNCSVAVVVIVPAGVPVPWPQALALAHSPDLQL
jgi:hypothetical protein